MIPIKNPKYTFDDVKDYKSKFRENAERMPHSFTGFDYGFEHEWANLTPAERNAILEDCWNDGSLKFVVGSFGELFVDAEVNAEISDFVRAKMRARIGDEKLCDLLIPSDYGFGTHRVPLEDNYLEIFHRPNVDLIGVRSNPVSEFVPEGIRTADGVVHPLDVVVFATGFDAVTGALTRIDVRGRNGRSLKADWNRDIRTTMGLMVHGYPNLFMTGAPLAPSAALCNMTTCLQQQVEWIADCIAHMRDNGVKVIEPTREAEDAWIAHHEELAATALVSKTSSWYTGSNVEGKPRRLLTYVGGVGVYRQKCAQVAADGYRGFTMQ